jgi:formate dehydrogenase subunit gamma
MHAHPNGVRAWYKQSLETGAADSIFRDDWFGRARFGSAQGVTHMDSTEFSEDKVRAIISRHVAREGALLPILHEVQATFGCVPPESVAIIAQGLNLSKAEVQGVVSFYHDFRPVPAGRLHVRICRAEACQAMGGRALGERVLRHLGISWGETTADGTITVSPVYCIGLCSVAPAAQFNDIQVGRLDVESVISELERLT